MLFQSSSTACSPRRRRRRATGTRQCGTLRQTARRYVCGGGGAGTGGQDAVGGGTAGRRGSHSLPLARAACPALGRPRPRLTPHRALRPSLLLAPCAPCSSARQLMLLAEVHAFWAKKSAWLVAMRRGAGADGAGAAPGDISAAEAALARLEAAQALHRLFSSTVTIATAALLSPQQMIRVREGAAGGLVGLAGRGARRRHTSRGPGGAPHSCRPCLLPLSPPLMPPRARAAATPPPPALRLLLPLHPQHISGHRRLPPPPRVPHARAPRRAPRRAAAGGRWRPRRPPGARQPGGAQPRAGRAGGARRAEPRRARGAAVSPGRRRRRFQRARCGRACGRGHGGGAGGASALAPLNAAWRPKELTASPAAVLRATAHEAVSARRGPTAPTGPTGPHCPALSPQPRGPNPAPRRAAPAAPAPSFLVPAAARGLPPPACHCGRAAVAIGGGRAFPFPARRALAPAPRALGPAGTGGARAPETRAGCYPQSPAPLHAHTPSNTQVTRIHTGGAVRDESASARIALPRLPYTAPWDPRAHPSGARLRCDP
jgi:hypothetical protein